MAPKPGEKHLVFKLMDDRVGATIPKIERGQPAQKSPVKEGVHHGNVQAV